MLCDIPPWISPTQRITSQPKGILLKNHRNTERTIEVSPYDDILGKVVNFGPDEDLILGSLMSHPHCTLLLDDARMRRMTSK